MKAEGTRRQGAKSQGTVLLRFPIQVLSALSALSTLSALPPLSAQTQATGRVLNGDSVPLAGIRVVLHRVGQDAQGPIDSTRSDRDGRFRFSFHPDTAAFYLVSGRYAGIEYFSNPVATNPHRADSAVTVVVYDTSTTAPVIIEARHLVVTRPGENGDRGVLDLVILKNTGRRTRIAPDTLHPSWSIPLPAGTVGLDVGESDISAGAVARRGDSLLISAAISPGEKQLTLQYEIPAGTDSIRLAIRNSGVTVNVLAEEPGTRVAGPGLALADSQVIQGRSFRRWTGRVSAPGVIRIAVARRPATPRWLLITLVAGLGLGLAVAAWYLLARKPATRTRPPDALVSAIAELDARYLGRQEEVGQDEWQSYQTQRAQLKAELEASLAGGGWTP